MENVSKSQLKRLAIQRPDELKQKVWKSGEEAAWLADKIVTGSPDYCQSAAPLLRKYSTIEQQLAELLEASKALVARWETPLWKDVPPTGEAIYRLRDVINKIEGVK